MGWFGMFCLMCVACYFFASKILGLSWLWSGLFSLFTSLAMTLLTVTIEGCRLCPRRVKAALQAGLREPRVRMIIEGAFPFFSKRGDEVREAHVWGYSFYAYLPFAIVSWKLLEPFSMATIVRVLSAAVLAAPCTAVLGKLASILAGEKRMMNKVAAIVNDDDPETWYQMMCHWTGREYLKEKCASCASTIRKTFPLSKNEPPFMQAARTVALEKSTKDYHQVGTRCRECGKFSCLHCVREGARCPVCGGPME